MLSIQHFRYLVQLLHIMFTLLSMSFFNEYKREKYSFPGCHLLCSHPMKEGGRASWLDLLSAQDISLGRRHYNQDNKVLLYEYCLPGPPPIPSDCLSHRIREKEHKTGK